MADVVALVDRCDGVGSLLALGASALMHEGDLRAGRQRYDAAYREAVRVGDAGSMAEAALGLAGLWVHEHRTAAGAALLTQRLRRALSLVDPDSPVALRLRIRIAGEADYRAGTSVAVLPLLEEAARAGDPVARAEALSIAHHCLLGPEHSALRRSLAAELVAESFGTARRGDLLMGLLWQTVDLFLDGDPHAGRRLGELREMLSGQDHLAVGFVVDAIDVMLAVRAGDFARAERLAQACAQRGADAGDIDATGWHGAQLVAIRWYQGRLVELLPLLAELADSPTLSAVDNSFLAARAVAAAMAGDRPAAASALATLCGADLAGLPHSSSWLVTMHGVVEAAHLLDDAQLAARAYALLLPHADRPMIGSLGVVCFGSAHHALGVASLATGDLGRAVEHLGNAVRQNLALAHWPAVVTSRRRLAEALVRRGEPGDAATAERELATAAQEARTRGIAAPDGASSTTSTLVTCTRRGRHWQVALGQRSVLVDHRIGMFHLAVLVANPGQEIHAVDLAAGQAVPDVPEAWQPVLDRVAIREYRNRIGGLRRTIDELDERTDAEHVAAARTERDWLVAELAGAVGLAGRTRCFTGNRERARIAVGKAIWRAIDHIAKADPVIAEHLAGTVRTGLQCSYRYR